MSGRLNGVLNEGQSTVFMNAAFFGADGLFRLFLRADGLFRLFWGEDDCSALFWGEDDCSALFLGGGVKIVSVAIGKSLRFLYLCKIVLSSYVRER